MSRCVRPWIKLTPEYPFNDRNQDHRSFWIFACFVPSRTSTCVDQENADVLQ